MQHRCMARSLPALIDPSLYQTVHACARFSHKIVPLRAVPGGELLVAKSQGKIFILNAGSGILKSIHTQKTRMRTQQPYVFCSAPYKALTSAITSSAKGSSKSRSHSICKIV